MTGVRVALALAATGKTETSASTIHDATFENNSLREGGRGGECGTVTEHTPTPQ